MDEQWLKQLSIDALARPDVWWAGYNASMTGKQATACPYNCSDEMLMNVWLSGHVTATERKQINA